MADTRNDLFVGSSSEFLKLSWDPAKVIQEKLDGRRLLDGSVLSVNIWRDWFQEHPGLETFQILDLAAKTAEWAVLIFRSDDLRRSVAQGSIQTATVRDNVLFELGLFYGYLGTQRVFILEQVETSGRAARVAGDIGGVQRLRFSSRSGFIGVLEAVGRAIDQRSTRFFTRWAPSSSLAIGYCEQALKPFVTRRRDHAGGRGSFRLETLIPFESFDNLEFSEVRQLFEGAGYQQVGPDGSFSGRPAMWVRKTRRQAHEAYYDIPTTLLTAKRVIDNYLEAHATPDEMSRLGDC
jgi:hypothetical protein